MLVHKYMMKAMSNIVVAASSFIALMVMTRYVSYEYGVMMWGFAFIALFNIVAGLGFETAHIKFIAGGRDQNACFSTYTVIRSSLTLLMVVLSSVTVFVSFKNGTMDGELVRTLFILIAYYAIWDIRSIYTVTYDARLESGKSSIVLISESVIRSAILIVLALMQVSADALSLAYLIGAIVAVIMALLLSKSAKIRFTRPTMIKEYAVFAAPLILSSLVLMVVEALDRVIIGLNGDVLEVSYYAAAMGVVVAAVSLGNSMNNVILPQLSSSEVVSSKNKTEGLVWISQKYLLMLLLPVTAVVIVYGESISAVLFGADFTRAGLILSILSVMMTLKIISGVLAQVLYASNKAGLYTKASVIYGILVIVLYVLFIPSSDYFPWTGGIGAALAVSIGSVVYIILLTYYVKHSTGVGIYPNLWKHLLSMAATLIVMLVVMHYFDISGLVWVAAVSLSGLSVHMLVLFLTGELRKSDIEFFKNAINPKHLMKSLEDEFD